MIFHADADVSPLYTQVYAQSRPREASQKRDRRRRRRWHGFPAAGLEGCRGCNVVISDKRLPGDTHCAPLAASTLLTSFGAERVSHDVHAHARNNAPRARHVPLVTVHYVANRDISLGHYPSTSRHRVSRPNLSAMYNRYS